ncbi:MAG: helix-turn-helix domain-containing protein [Chthoniobacterales bacterium]
MALSACVNSIIPASAPEPTVRRLGYGRIEAARLLGISPPTLDRLVARGLLKPSRALRRPLFTEAELLRFLEDTK